MWCFLLRFTKLDVGFLSVYTIEDDPTGSICFYLRLHESDTKCTISTLPAVPLFHCVAIWVCLKESVRKRELEAYFGWEPDIE
jgi:hypothetical protein